MGKPLIATDVPGCREIAREGLNGFLCRVADPVSLAESIEKMVNVEEGVRQRMGAKSREIAEQEYDEKIVLEAYFGAMGFSDADKKMIA
jgi:glycosyltransferase involved in cell wall biosynthesis